MDILKRISKYNIHIKLIIITFLALSTLGVILYVRSLSSTGFYEYLNSESYYRIREIHTPLKLWLNGYFGIFFRVHDFGYLILLIFPCYLFIILCWEKISRAAKILLFVFSMTAILLGIKGFYNFRYAFTLFPFVILSIFWLSYDILDRVKAKVHRKRPSLWIFLTIFIYLSIGFLLIYSIGVRKNGYLRYWRYGNSIEGPTMNFIHSLKKLNISDDRKILVVNINGWFYHTNIKGVMYKSFGFPDNSNTLWDKIQKENIRYILAEDYVFILPKYNSLGSLLKDKSKTKPFRKGGYLTLYVVRR